ncbi:MAG: hypothetical protein V3V80_02365 [Dehalococcoidia bacterium]
MSASTATKIPCPLCRKAFDVRRHHRHVEKRRRLDNAKKERTSAGGRAGRRGG